MNTYDDNETTVRNGSANFGETAVVTALAPERVVPASSPLAAPEAVPSASPRAVSSLTALPANVYRMVESWKADRITRLRDRHGNRQPWYYSYLIAIVDDVVLEKTPLAGAIAFLRERDPLLADKLHHFYDRQLLPALRTLLAVSREECEALQRYNAYVVQRGAEIDAEQNRLLAERDGTTARDREAIVAMDGPIQQAHEAASEAVARTGATYDAASPSEEIVLRVRPHSQEAAAAKLELPWVLGDEKGNLPKWAATLCMLFIGCGIGLSIGILTHMVQLDSLDANPIGLGCWMAAGVAAAVFGGEWTKQSAREASKQVYLRFAWAYWLLTAALVMGMFAPLAVVAIDSLTEREGMLAPMRERQMFTALGDAPPARAGKPEDAPARGRSAVEDSGTLFLLVAMLLSLPYVGTKVYEGIRLGRYHEVMNRIRHFQETDVVQQEREARQRPEVQSALRAIAQVWLLLHGRQELEQRVVRAAAPWDVRIAAIEGERPAARAELDAAALLRIQDQLDNLAGTQATWDTMLEDTLARYGAAWSWRRLLPWFRPRARRRTRNDSRRL